jgi:hypothetical protein
MEIGKANNIKSSTFDSSLSEKYSLTVQIGLKKFSYSIIDSFNNNVEYFNTFKTDDNIIDIINNETFLKLNFKSSLVIFTDFPSTLVPAEIFNKEITKEILEFTTDTYDIIKSDFISKINGYLIYTIPSVMNDISFTFFPHAKQKAKQSILIDHFSSYINKDDSSYLNVSDNNINLTIFRNNKLIFHNAFMCASKEDILYYILFTFEQLKLDTETIQLYLYGEINKGDENYKILYEYIRHIKFVERPMKIKISSDLIGIKEHQFIELFCEQK